MRKLPSWRKDYTPKNSPGGKYHGPTLGLSSPKNNRRGCLCLDGKKYSRECCDGFLINQGIGATEQPRGYRGDFSTAFAQSFNRSEKD